MVDVTDVEVLHDRVVRLQFSDRSDRVVDLAPLLWGPVFEDIATDDALFAQVEVDPDIGTIVWPNGADLDSRRAPRRPRTSQSGTLRVVVNTT